MLTGFPFWFFITFSKFSFLICPASLGLPCSSCLYPCSQCFSLATSGMLCLPLVLIVAVSRVEEATAFYHFSVVTVVSTLATFSLLPISPTHLVMIKSDNEKSTQQNPFVGSNVSPSMGKTGRCLPADSYNDVQQCLDR